MTIDEKDAVDTARTGVETIAAILEMIADRCADPTIKLCLRGVETIATSITQDMAAITQ